MAGRLTISRQKSYCPWKPENIARAARKEEARIESETKRDRNELQRALEMRSRSDKCTPQHVNLFEKEEKEHSLMQGILTNKKRKSVDHRRCTAVYLDQSTRQNSKRIEPWKYDKQRKSSIEHQSKVDTEKQEMDPMKEFHRETKNRKEDRLEKRKKRDKRKRSATEIEKGSLDELRKRRLLREAQERERERAITNSYSR